MHAHVKTVSVLQSYCNPSSTYVDTTGNVPSVKDRFQRNQAVLSDGVG